MGASPKVGLFVALRIITFVRCLLLPVLNQLEHVFLSFFLSGVSDTTSRETPPMTASARFRRLL